MRGLRHRRALRLLAPAIWAAVVGCNRVQVGEAPGSSPRSSVLLVTIDTLRADHVGSYGALGVATPNLDRVAVQGVRFDQAIAPAPITLPSHASLFTALYPPTHGVRHNGVYVLGERFVTLAERYREAGYQTGAVVGAIVLSGRFGIGQGFTHYDDAIGGAGSSLSGYPERDAAAVTDRALAWLDATPGPFFLWVHYYDPHARYSPPEPHATEFADRPYDGEIAHVDVQLGRLLRAVRQHSEVEPLIALTSDHGEGLGEHGERTHSVLLYDSVLRIPLVMSGPGLPAGRSVDEVASLVDVAPTLLALSALPPIAGAQGRDLRVHLDETPGAAEPGWAYAESLVAHLTMGWSPLHAIRTASHLYVRAPRPELFDALRDPGQLTNLLPDAEGSAPVALADRALASVLGGGSDPNAMQPLDPATRARIEALGYALPTPGAVADPTGLTFDPKDGLPWIEKAMAAHDAQFAGRPDLAESWAREVVERFPESQRGHEILTQVYLRSRRYAKARHHAEALARLAPAWAEHHARVGLTRLRTGDLEGAVAAFEEALARDDGHVGAHLGVMRKLELGGSVAEAEVHAAYVLAHSGREVDFDQVGEIWAAAGHPERAALVWRTGTQRHPASQRLRRRLAGVRAERASGPE